MPLTPRVGRDLVYTPLLGVNMSFNTSAGNAPRPANQGQQLLVRQPQALSVNFGQSAYNQQVLSFTYSGLADEEVINSSQNLHAQYQPCQPIFYREVPAALSPFDHHSKRLCDNAEPQSASSLAGAYPNQRTAGNASNQTISGATKDYSTRSMNEYEFPGTSHHLRHGNIHQLPALFFKNPNPYCIQRFPSPSVFRMPSSLESVSTCPPVQCLRLSRTAPLHRLHHLNSEVSHNPPMVMYRLRWGLSVIKDPAWVLVSVGAGNRIVRQPIR
jgi:hypothetical protein